MATLLVATPASASQPVWQPAIYCAALDFTRAELLAETDRDTPDWAGTPQSAEASARAYLRIAAEALDCPGDAVLHAHLDSARLGVRHRVEVATGYGIPRAVMALPIASEAELVCGLNFEPEILAAARAAETTDPPEPLCLNTD